MVRNELSPELANKKNLYYPDLPPAVQDRLWEMFERALLPLHSPGKLGVIVLQFPSWFMPRRAVLQSHRRVLAEAPCLYRVSVEFRNRSRLNE